MKKRFPLLLKVLPFFAYAFIALSFIFMTGCSNTLSLLPNLTHPPIIDKQTYKKEEQS